MSHYTSGIDVSLEKAWERIRELEAERDRLREAAQKLVGRYSDGEHLDEILESDEWRALLAVLEGE